jgi:hypothetical protein
MARERLWSNALLRRTRKSRGKGRRPTELRSTLKIRSNYDQKNEGCIEFVESPYDEKKELFFETREAKKREVVTNTYEVITDMNGNTNSPAEFVESRYDKEELFFKAEKGATTVCTLVANQLLTFLRSICLTRHNLQGFRRRKVFELFSQVASY